MHVISIGFDKANPHCDYLLYVHYSVMTTFLLRHVFVKGSVGARAAQRVE